MSRWLIPGAPLAALLLTSWLVLAGWEFAAAVTAGVTLWCAVWWVFEPVPIPFTSMLPFALFVSLGVLSPAQAAQAFGNPIILLLLGGFMISEAMADSGAHRRVALYLVNLVGGHSARKLVLGFGVAAGVMSMWISNTATTLMLLPVALAVLAHADRKLAVPLLLGICYCASIGGIGTPIGTPPNLMFIQVHADTFGRAPTFPEWMSWGVPVVIVMVPLTVLWLTRGLELEHPVKLPAVGPWQPAEKRVLTLFAVTALAWITREAPGGGWSEWLNLPGANDASVALLAAVLMAALSDGKGGRLLSWESAVKIPWGVLILFAGGIAIANAFISSGLADRLASELTVLANVPPFVMILAICLGVTFLTEITSNTATASLLMPLLASASLVMDINPMLLMVPAAMSASCAFMLPVATGPNAVIFGSHRVTIREMAKAGFVLNLVGAAVITLICYWLLG